MDENRPESPYLEESTSGHQKYITSREKIHRIRCMVGYYAKVSAVYSPNEIWLLIPNNIADKLVLSRDNLPPLETEIQPNSYVMTPINEKKLARARILLSQNREVFVRLIDSGKIEKRSFDQLYEMNDELRTHPWQAIQVSLHNVHPQNDDAWLPHEIETLESVLADFPYVWVDPQLTQKAINNDSEPVRVLLNGLSDEEVEIIETTQRTSYDDFGESIVDKYLIILPQVTLAPKRIIDAMAYNIYLTHSDL
uniref:Tudor domain-containing protein n=1 Tax=Panagrolaimus superbus TaxID=310955 RepID=A0A914XR52_9BILA